MSKKRIVIKEEEWKDSIYSTVEWEESVTINKWEHDYMKGEYIIDYVSSDEVEVPKSRKVEPKKKKEKKLPTKDWYSWVVENCIKERQKYIDKNYSEDSFEITILNKTIENLKNGSVSIQDNSSKGLHYFKNEIAPFYQQITKIIHNTHPEKKLEYFLADIFENISNVTEVKVNGSGWGTDYGADIIVRYNSGLEILDLNKEDTLVVQVKSYEGEHWNTEAVSQIKTAIETFNANTGMIITTAKSTENIEKEIEKVSNELNVPISLIAGENVAKFVLKYGKDLLFDI